MCDAKWGKVVMKPKKDERVFGIVAKNWRVVALSAIGSVLIVSPAWASIPIPEPNTISLFAAGVAAVLIISRRRRK